MNRGIVLGALVAAILLVLGTLWWFRPDPAGDVEGVLTEVGSGDGIESEDGAESMAEATLEDVQEGEPLRLYFPAADGFLHLEARAVPEPDPSSDLEVLRHERAVAVAEALVTAPESGELFPVFDEGTSVDQVRLDPGGIAIVSLSPAPGSVNRGSSSRMELLRVYSVVNSLAESVPGVSSVILVWAGQQPTTLGGHVDLTRPIKPSRRWIAVGGRSGAGAASP